jgi:alpha-ribazole phosphatase/probable phosphoglycerate mutase
VSKNVVAGLSGAVPHVPLTERGRAQAAAMARALTPVDHVYTSTAERARLSEPGRRRRRSPALKVSRSPVMPGLVEMEIGDLEGTADPAARAWTAAVLRAWVVDGDLDARVADGETGRAVVARITAAFETIAAAHRDGGTVAVVGHVASLTAELSVLCGLGPAVWGAPLPHAVPFQVLRDGLGWRCVTWPEPRPETTPEATPGTRSGTTPGA